MFTGADFRGNLVGCCRLLERMKAVFTIRVSPDYDDLPEHRYHFPRTYLNQVSAAIGDWIVYYEPRRLSSLDTSASGRQAYFAIARVDSVVPDPARPDHFYALMSDYLPFFEPIPFKRANTTYESALQKPDRSTNKGAFGRAVRTVPDAEFNRICEAGFAHVMGLQVRHRPGADVPEEPYPPLPIIGRDVDHAEFEVDRPIVRQVVARPFRDRAFAAAVKAAYQDTCAVSGLKIINGGGRSEVQAAHIRPVADNGPDSVRNGLALSATVHWMFDRGLLAIDDDFSILLNKTKVPPAFDAFVRNRDRIAVPKRVDLRPHSEFLRYHRENVFKG